MGPTTAVALPHRTVMTIRPISWVRATRLPSGDPRHHYRQQDNFQRLQGADIQRTGLPEA